MGPNVRCAAVSGLLILSFVLLAFTSAFADEPKPVSDAVTTDCSWVDRAEIAAGPHGFLVVFGGSAMRLDSLGNRLDERRFTVSESPVKTAWFAGRYVAIDWRGGGSFISEDGLVTPFELPLDMRGLYAVAVNGDRLLMIYWQDPSSLRLAILDLSLNVLADSLIADVKSWWYIESVAATATSQGFLIAYTLYESDWASEWGANHTTWARHVEGTNISAAALLGQNVSHGGDVALAWDGNRAILVFAGNATNDAAMTHVFLDGNGTAVSQPTVTPGRVWSPHVSWTGSEFLIAYVTKVSAGDVAMVRIDPETGVAGPPMPVVVDDAEQADCAIATGTDSIVIAWNSYWGWTGVKSVAWDRRFVPRQLPQVLSRAYASQRAPVVASLDGTNLVVWWEGRCQGLIVAARIRDDGEAMDGSGVVLSDAAASDPRVIPAGDRFVVYWIERRPDETLFTVLQPVTKDLELLPRIVLPYWVFQIVDSPAHDELLTISPVVLHENDRFSSLAVKRLLGDGSIVDGAIVSVLDRNPAAVDLVASDDGYLLVFDDALGGCQITCPPSYYEYVSRVYAQRLDSEGNAMSPLVTLADHATSPQARWTGTDYLVTLSSQSMWRVFIHRDGLISSLPGAGAVPYVENVTEPYDPVIVRTLTDGDMTMIARGTSDRELSGSSKLDPNSRLFNLADGGLRLVYVGDRPPTTGSTRVYSCRVSDVVNDISIAFVNVPSRVDSAGEVDVPLLLSNKGRTAATAVGVSFSSYGANLLPGSATEDLQPGESRTITARAYAGPGVTRLFANVIAAERDPYPVDNAASHDIIVSPCGDANGDGYANGADVFYLVNYLLAGTGAPFRGDANGDGVTTMADVFYLVNYVFATGSAPGCP